MKQTERLSNASVKAATNLSNRPKMFHDGDGLYLLLGPVRSDGGNGKSWVFRFMVAGKQNEIGLGSVRDRTLSEARQKAKEYRRMLADGLDPRSAKASLRAPKQAATTFEQAAREWLDKKLEPTLKSTKDISIWRARFEQHLYPSLGSIPIDKVDTDAVLAAIEPLWKSKTETASRLRGKLEAVLDYAKVRGMRSGENPAAWKNHLENILPAVSKITEVEQHVAMPYADMPEFWTKLNAYQGRTKQARIAADALRWTILTVARGNEARGARVNEIDFDNQLWTIPANRMKEKVEHTVPLSSWLVGQPIYRVLRGDGINTTSQQLFPISDNAVRRLARKLYGKLVPVKHADGTVTQEEIDIHGFRSCFADWATETLVVTGKPLGDNKTIVTKPLVDASLAHKEGSKTDRAYVRTSLIKERRPLMEAWADYCASETPAYTTSETGAGDGESDPTATPDDGDSE